MGEAKDLAMHAPARVFVVRGDVLELACDHVVLPTDEALVVEDYWHRHLRRVGVEVEVTGVGGPGVLSSSLRSEEGSERVLGPFDAPGVDGARSGSSMVPTTWLLAAAVASPDEDGRMREVDLVPLDEALRQFGERFPSFAVPEEQKDGRPKLRPVVAMPLLGSGQGGYRQRMRAYADQLMRRLTALAARIGVDIVVVVHGRDRHAAAWVETCRRALRDQGGVDHPGAAGAARPAGRSSAGWRVGRPVKPGREPADGPAAIQVLRDHAAAGTLVPFFGSGVSLASSAPSWSKLLEGMETKHKVPPAGGEVDLFDRAQVLVQQVGEEVLRAELTEAFAGLKPNLLHLLLAGLEARDAVTTNFDRLYEEAVQAGFGDVLSVIPMEGSQQRLLKLHGSVALEGASPVPGHPVLTRSDVIEHGLTAGVLRGALQMLLLTGHVVFVGYGMGDPSLYQALFEIRRIRRSAGLEDAGPVATALMAEPAPDLARLWGPDVTVLWPEQATTTDPSVGGSYIAELLDLLVDQRAFDDVPVLAFRDEELTPAEQRLRALLDGLQDHYGEVGRVPAEVSALLRRYGATPEPPGSS